MLGLHLRKRRRRVRFSTSTRRKVLKRDHQKCAYCGRKLSPGYFHVDHVKPVSHGGSNKPGNLRASCPSCNLRKGATVVPGRRVKTQVKRFRKQRQQEARQQIKELKRIAGREHRWWRLWLF